MSTALTDAQQPELRILRRRQVEQITGLPTSTLYAKIKANAFPAPFSLGGARSVGWDSRAVFQW